MSGRTLGHHLLVRLRLSEDELDNNIQLVRESYEEKENLVHEFVLHQFDD